MPDDTWPTAVLACPHCAQPLALSSSEAACPAGHNFDRAREGYLNLLVGGRLNSGTVPGDTAESLAARRRFLASGNYAPIAAALDDAVGELDGVVLDVGCGEGYYTSHLRAARCCALDVSKQAIKMAARLLPSALSVVGSAYRLPFQDSSLDVVTSVFAPHPVEEFARVLRPGGRWVTITPGPQHLVEMHPAIADDGVSKAAERRRRRSEPLAQAATAQRCEFTVELNPAAGDDLFAMTPIRWQAGARPVLHSVTVDVWVSTGVRAP